MKNKRGKLVLNFSAACKLSERKHEASQNHSSKHTVFPAGAGQNSELTKNSTISIQLHRRPKSAKKIQVFCDRTSKLCEMQDRNSKIGICHHGRSIGTKLSAYDQIIL